MYAYIASVHVEEAKRRLTYLNTRVKPTNEEPTENPHIDTWLPVEIQKKLNENPIAISAELVATNQASSTVTIEVPASTTNQAPPEEDTDESGSDKEN
jgi:hypothetical protein